MQIEKTASRQRGKTIRIITDLPVLVQSESTVTRKGHSKPVTVLHCGYLFALSVSDSGEPVVKVVDPPPPS